MITMMLVYICVLTTGVFVLQFFDLGKSTTKLEGEIVQAALALKRFNDAGDLDAPGRHRVIKRLKDACNEYEALNKEEPAAGPYPDDARPPDAVGQNEYLLRECKHILEINLKLKKDLEACDALRIDAIKQLHLSQDRCDRAENQRAALSAKLLTIQKAKRAKK